MPDHKDYIVTLEDVLELKRKGVKGLLLNTQSFNMLLLEMGEKCRIMINQQGDNEGIIPTAINEFEVAGVRIKHDHDWESDTQVRIQLDPAFEERVKE